MTAPSPRWASARDCGAAPPGSESIEIRSQLKHGEVLDLQFLRIVTQ
jgi:hypothetical protein